MLVLPETVTIRLTDPSGNRLRKENVLIGIHTYATKRNNIELYPFLTDKDGEVVITRRELQDTADNYVAYGLMDYVRIEYANPRVQIYVWGIPEIRRYIDYWSEVLKKKASSDDSEDLLYAKLREEDRKYFMRESEETTQKENAMLDLFLICTNGDLDFRLVHNLEVYWEGLETNPIYYLVVGE